MKIKDLKIHPQNPRLIKDHKFKQLCQSIKTSPWIMELKPIVHDENNIILAGNQRFKALLELGYKELPDKWTKKISGLSEQQKAEFQIKDNLHAGDWDFDLLANEWEAEELKLWGMDGIEQLEETLRTFIQSMYGAMNKKLLGKLGYTEEMIKKCPTLFNKNGFQKFKDYLSINGIKEIKFINLKNKYYIKI